MVKVLAVVCGSVGWKAFLGLISPGACSEKDYEYQWLAICGVL